MKKFFLPVIALCFSISLAQFEEDNIQSEEANAQSEDDTARFEEDEWADFDYQHAGLSQTEFQSIKESKMSKEKLMYLLEIGIRPLDYLKEPWKDLGVSEKEWLEERAGGMEDSDIDRTYRNRSGNQGLAYLSYLVPSLYQWSEDKMAYAIAMDVSYAAFWSVTIFVLDGTKEKLIYGLPLIAAVHLWSGTHAVLSTLWDNNPDARNFSWGIVPTGRNSFAATATFRF